MTAIELEKTLNYLCSLPAETEVVEFKEAKYTYDFNKLGKCFSAISNESNLKSQSYGWLIFGVEDKTKTVVGTQYPTNRADLDRLKGEIASKTNRITFIEIHELSLTEGRVVLFQIPAAPRGIPTSWEGHFYARDGEESTSLSIEKLERIRAQVVHDWSAEICTDATLADLDEAAILQARKNYKAKNPEKALEVDSWDDLTFLNKSKVTIRGKITRTAIILLGRSESEHFIGPSMAKIRWVLKGAVSDSQIEPCPFLLAVDKIYAKIRNVKYQRIQGNTLFPDEMLRYDPYVIREAINNCIAHQDYSLSGFINVIETNDSLIFSNKGCFIPESVEKVVIDNAPEEHYRNPFLASAMCNLKMVDTLGGGIYKMFQCQMARFFPMPEYKLEPERVEVTITGKVIDLKFGQVIAENPHLTLSDIILLDKVQKHKMLTEAEVKHLKEKQMIEGRKPNYFISAAVVSEISNSKIRAQYTRQRGVGDDFCKEMILKHIDKLGSATRREIDSILTAKLSEALNEKQKRTKITNLLSALRMAGKIQRLGYSNKSTWVLVKQV